MFAEQESQQRRSRKNRKTLNETLGISKVIWLGKELEPDPVTDGHIDGIAAFAEPGVVMLHTTDDRSDPNDKICQDAKRRLLASTDAKGRKIEIIEVPLDGDLSYMNLYIANRVILVSVTKDSQQDERPMGFMKEVFSDYEVVGIDSNVLGEGGGGIHHHAAGNEGLTNAFYRSQGRQSAFAKLIGNLSVKHGCRIESSRIAAKYKRQWVVAERHCSIVLGFNPRSNCPLTTMSRSDNLCLSFL